MRSYSLIIFAALAAAQASAQAVAVDSAGYIYETGSLAHNGELATTPGVFQPYPGGPGYVKKLTPSGDNVVWATYLSSGLIPSALALAPDGSVFVAGSVASGEWLPALGGYQSTPAGLFVVKLNAYGSALLGGTYFGGGGSPEADSIAAMQVDSGGSVYIAGDANSIPFPTTPGAYQRERSSVSGTCTEGSDEFVAKFDAGLTTLMFSTLIGTAGRNDASGLALGPDGSVYVVGTHGTERGPCPANGVVNRLSADARTLIYSTPVGRPPQGAYAIAVDGLGNAFAGSDSRKWPPPESGTITEVDPKGRVVALREIGGSVQAIAAGPDGDIAVAGYASPALLTPTDDGPGLCGVDVYRYRYTSGSYTARLRARSIVSVPVLEITYAGFLSGDLIYGLFGVDRVLARHPYGTLAPFALLPTGPPAPGTVTCLTSSANYAGHDIGPGELVAMFGSQIGPETPLGLELDAAGNVTKNLGGISVLVDGIAAPMLYAGPGQINFVVPFGAGGGAAARVELRRDSAVVSAFDTGTASGPGLFRADGTPTGPLAAINQDGTVNSASNPAAPGSVISLYGTGFGAMTPEPADGERAPLPANQPVASVTATVNGEAAEVQYAGNAPTLVAGVVQINVRLPEALAPVAGLEPNTAGVQVQQKIGTGGPSDYGIVYVR